MKKQNPAKTQDQNTKFWRFKKADSRHFENGFIAISLLGIMQFQCNLVRWRKFWFQGRSGDKVSKFCKLKMADGRHFENRFRLHLTDLLSH